MQDVLKMRMTDCDLKVDRFLSKTKKNLSKKPYDDGDRVQGWVYDMPKEYNRVDELEEKYLDGEICLILRLLQHPRLLCYSFRERRH